MSGFATVPLGEIVQSSPVHRAGEAKLPILSITMRDGLVLQRSKFKKRIASKNTRDYRVVRRGQLVVGFPIDEGVLSFQQLYEKAVVSPAYGIWDVRKDREEKVWPDYLERYLRSPRALAYYRSKLRGTTARRRSLPRGVFLSMPIPLPPLSEQRRIADILDRVDELRVKRRAAIADLDSLAQSIFIDMFGEDGQSNAHWGRFPLSDVVREGTSVTYGIVQAGKEHPGGVPYIRTGDIVQGAVVEAGLRRTSPDLAAKFRRSRVETGDVVMSIRATVGTTAPITERLSGANLTQGTARIAPGDRTRSRYLLHFLRLPKTQQWIQRQVKGATFREITLGRLRELEVVLPPLELQDRFVAKSVAVERLVEQSHASEDEVNTLFSSLQYRAFRGEL